MNTWDELTTLTMAQRIKRAVDDSRPLAIIYALPTSRSREWHRTNPVAQRLLAGFRVEYAGPNSAARLRGRQAAVLVELDPLTDEARAHLLPCLIGTPGALHLAP